MSKISILGAGKVGSTVIQLAAYKNLADIVLFNRTLEKAEGLVLDLLESATIEHIKIKIKATNDYSDTKDSDIVIITAGVPRKEGMTREKMLNINAEIVKTMTSESVKYSKNAFYIVVTNPLDAMAYFAYKTGNLKREKIIGMAGNLDTSRFAYFISKELNVPVESVNALVLGSHGDLMVPIISQTTVNGKALNKILSLDKINELVEKTRNAGAEIITLLGESAFFDPASAVIQITESVLHDRKETIPCSTYLQGEYGIKDTFIGVPVVIGKNGIEKIVEIKLTDKEKQDLTKSANAVKELIKQLKL